MSTNDEDPNGIYEITFSDNVITGVAQMRIIQIFDGDEFSNPTIRGYIWLPSYSTNSLIFSTVNGSLTRDNTIIYLKQVLIEVTLL